MSQLCPDENKTLEILIVDDDRIVRMLHRHTLERCNIKDPIVVLSHGKEAIEYLSQQQHAQKNFLVLLDINMPVMNGWEFLEECHKNACAENIFTVIVSSSINVEDKIKAGNFPQVLDFLEKPFTLESVAKLQDLKELKDL